jgi:hypothetical protein
MSTSELTPYLLESSLVQYTVTTTKHALQALNEQTKKRAKSALKFFLDILDPSIELERQKRDIFQSYLDAVNGAPYVWPSSFDIHCHTPDPRLGKAVLDTLPSRDSTIQQTLTHPEVLELTPAQQVLTLPDTLDLIFAQIPLLTKSDRDAICKVSLTSQAFHNATQLRLWRRPRDLDTIEKQVKFAFGTAISGSVNESLGNYVQRLRIRLVKGLWNARLVEKIAALIPGVTGFTLHWGDVVDGGDPVTNDSITSIYRILAALPNLKRLQLMKFVYSPELESELSIPADAYLPFTKLEHLQLYDFHWYWPPIAQGLGSSLKSLDIGFGTRIESQEIVNLSYQTPSLSSLRLCVSLEVEDIRTIVRNVPGLESIDIIDFSEIADTYAAEVVPVLASLEALKELSLHVELGVAQVDILAASRAPLEDIAFVLESTSDAPKVLAKLLKSKSSTLKSFNIIFESTYQLPATDEFLAVLGGIPHLTRIYVDFDTSSQPSASAVEALLKQCPELVLTDGLESLVRGNALYEAEYKARLETLRDEEDKEYEEDILGN